MTSWTISGRFLTKPIMGVTRYAREVVRELDRLVGEGHPSTRDLSFDIVVPMLPTLPLELDNIPIRVAPGGNGYFWEQFVLPFSLRNRRLLSLCNVGPVFFHDQIVCIHGMNTAVAPNSYTALFRRGYGAVRDSVAKTARHVTTVSDFSRSQLVQHRVCDAGKISLAPCGSDHVQRWNINLTDLSGDQFQRPFVLALATSGAHKNLGLLVRIAERLDDLGLDVVIAGGKHHAVFAGEHSTPEPSNVRRLGYVSDADLAFLYSRAHCFAFPSTTEGFGIPPLEAYRFGCPVVASNSGSIPEILSAGATLVDPHDEDAWIDAIRTLLVSEVARSENVAIGKSRADFFSWRRTALAYLELMRSW